MISLRVCDDIPYLFSPQLEQLEGVSHGYSTRLGGVSEGPYASLNLSFRVGDDPGRVAENRRRFFALFSVDPTRVVTVRQVHGVKAVAIESSNVETCSWDQLEADALMTNLPGVAIAILTADCMPVLLVDPFHRAVAVVHAGRLGMAQRVLSRTVEAMAARYGSSPGDLIAALGPHVRQCCYTLPEELVEPFRKREGSSESIVIQHGRGEWALDLSGAACQELESLGVPSDRMDTCQHCTACGRDLFYSYRAEGRRTGRLLSFALLTEESKNG